jgi:hypothetical protein
MRFNHTKCKRLQGAANARRQARRRTFVLQVPDNKADVVPCERLQKMGIIKYKATNGYALWKGSAVKLA